LVHNCFTLFHILLYYMGRTTPGQVKQ
jgi:hypothetical protein